MNLTIGNSSLSLPVLIACAVVAALAIMGFWHAIIVSLRNNQRDRELQSLERIKAIECGYPLDQPKLMTVAIAIGVAVPCSSVGAAFIATAMNAPQYAWPAAAVIGTSAVICATILALKAAKFSQQEDLRRKPVMSREQTEVADYHS